MFSAAALAASTSIPGLSEQEAQARRARGQGNDVETKSGRTYGQILRDNVFTFFNLVLFGLGALLLILGSPRDAFFTVIVAFINILVTTYQEAQAKRQLDRIALLTRSKARVVRDGQERAIACSPAALSSPAHWCTRPPR
jgi:cation-transporting ATPase E